MSNDHPLIADWRAQGRSDKLDRYVELSTQNADAKKRILDAFDGAISGVAALDDVALSDRVRVGDELARCRRVVESSDFSPHPAAVDQMFDA